MGRSENSRNRMFVQEERAVRTKAVDESKMTDPSLIIYYPVRTVGKWTVVTNGDQTDTICQSIENGGCFRDALLTRTYEPDAPNYTPRISGAVCTADHKMSYLMSVLRKDEQSENCRRFFYKFSGVDAGVGTSSIPTAATATRCPPFSRAPVEIEMGLTPRASPTRSGRRSTRTTAFRCLSASWT
ncbi:MAG: IMP cyclohydrolase [Acutalibacteraceae bacterium]